MRLRRGQLIETRNIDIIWAGDYIPSKCRYNIISEKVHSAISYHYEYDNNLIDDTPFTISFLEGEVKIFLDNDLIVSNYTDCFCCFFYPKKEEYGIRADKLFS